LWLTFCTEVYSYCESRASDAEVTYVIVNVITAECCSTSR